MNSPEHNIQITPFNIEPLEDRIEILYRELELAIKWQRPSILLAIYGAEYIHTDASAGLEKRLSHLGQNVHNLQINNNGHPDISHLLSLADKPDLNKTIVFLEWGEGKDRLKGCSQLDLQRDYFIDKRIRVVFWMTEEEAIDLAHFAPDFWGVRHRVVEFIETVNPEQVLLRALESAWHGVGEFPGTLDDTDAKIALRESMLADLPKDEESVTLRANLLLTLGILHWRKGDFEKAAGLLETSLEIAEVTRDKWFEAVCCNAIALVKTDLGKINEAIDSYKKAIKLAPDQMFPWNNLGNLYSELGSNDEAIVSFKKAVEYDPTDAVSWNGFGNVYRRMGRIDESVAAYQKAIELAPTYANPWNGLGNVYESTERIEDAISAYRKAIELNQRFINPWLRLGDISGKERRNEQAITAYQKAIEIDPKNARVWNDLGNVYLYAGLPEEAINSFNRAIELDRGYGWPYSNLALAFSYSGRYQEAILLYQRSIELLSSTSDKAISWNRLGYSYLGLNEQDKATEAFRKADELDPENRAPRDERSAIPKELFVHESATAGDEVAPSMETQLSDKPEPGIALTTDDLSRPEPQHAAALQPQAAGTTDDAAAHNGGDGYFTAWLRNLEAVESVGSPSDAALDCGSSGGQLDGIDQTEKEVSVSNPAGVDRDPTIITPSIAEAKGVKKHEAARRVIIANLPKAKKSQSLEQERIVTVESTEISLPVPNTSPVEQSPAGNAMKNETPFSEPYPDEERLSRVTGHEEKLLPWTEVIPDEPSVRLGMDVIDTETDPKDARIWNELGNIYLNVGAEDEAIYTYSKAIQLDRGFGVSYRNLALAYSQKGRYAEAIRLYHKSIELLPSNKEKAISWNKMGDAYRWLNDYENAMAAYQKADELDPENCSLLMREHFDVLSNCQIG